MEDEKKPVLLTDTINGFSSSAERYDFEHPEEAIARLKAILEYKPEQPKKKKLLPKINNRPKPTMYQFPSVQLRADRRI